MLILPTVQEKYWAGHHLSPRCNKQLCERCKKACIYNMVQKNNLIIFGARFDYIFYGIKSSNG